MLGVKVVQPRSIMNFGLVVKPFGSTLKKILLGLVRSSNGTALVVHELRIRS